MRRAIRNLKPFFAGAQLGRHHAARGQVSTMAAVTGMPSDPSYRGRRHLADRRFAEIPTIRIADIIGHGGTR